MEGRSWWACTSVIILWCLSTYPFPSMPTGAARNHSVDTWYKYARSSLLSMLHSQVYTLTTIYSLQFYNFIFLILLIIFLILYIYLFLQISRMEDSCPRSMQLVLQDENMVYNEIIYIFVMTYNGKLKWEDITRSCESPITNIICLGATTWKCSWSNW